MKRIQVTIAPQIRVANFQILIIGTSYSYSYLSIHFSAHIQALSRYGQTDQRGGAELDSFE